MCGCLRKCEIWTSITTYTGRTVERTVVSHIVYEQNTHSAAVVCSGDSAEALLASSVPLRWGRGNAVRFNSGDRKAIAYNLQLYSFSIELNCTDFEVYANRGDEGGRPCVVAEPEQETGFSDTCQIDQVCTYSDEDGDEMYLSLQSAAASPYGLDVCNAAR
jgi:hypothetical protein